MEVVVMNREQAEHIAREHLRPQQIDDNDIHQWLEWLENAVRGIGLGSNKTFLSGGEAGISATVWKDKCLVYNLIGDKLCLHYYQLPQEVRDWAIGRNSRRLWFIDKDKKLAMLDLRNGEWMAFNYRLSYDVLLYAEEDKVIARCSDLLAIDVLSFQDSSLKRITSIPIFLGTVGDGVGQKILDSTFVPEEERFLILVCVYRNVFYEERLLLNLSLDGQVKWMLRFGENDVKLCYPFAVFFEKESKELFYVDLRKVPFNSVKIELKLKPVEKGLRLELHNAFVFGDELIIAVDELRRYLKVLVRVQSNSEVLHYVKGRWNRLGQLGKLLIGSGGFIYNLVDQQVVRGKKWSALLRQAIQDELEGQHRLSPIAKPFPIKIQCGAENSTPHTFQVFIRDSSVHIADARDKNFRLTNFVSSSSGDVLFLVNETAYFVPRDKVQIHYLLPELEGLLVGGWNKFTFDEQGRMWLCDHRGRFTVVVSPRGQEQHGFVLKSLARASVRTIAAYANRLAIALNSGDLYIYHYDGQFIEEAFRWKSDKEITGIKPDVVGKGWWVVMEGNVLSYLEPNANRLEPLAQLPHEIGIFGDWPDQTYFAYVNEANQICYTSNPRDGWQQTSLQNVLDGRQGYRLLLDSLHRLGGEFFLLASLYKETLLRPEAYLFMTLQSERIEPISMFHIPTYLTRYADWLLLYADAPLIPASSEIICTLMNEVPENKGLLFYSPSTGQFFAKPHVPYSIGQAMNRLLKKWVSR